MIYHYLDYCCRMKLFIASENRWPLIFLSYHMFLDTTSVKSLSQTLDFGLLLLSLHLYSLLSIPQGSGEGWLCILTFISLFFVAFGLYAEQWYIPPQTSSLCSGLNSGGSSSKPCIKWPKRSACHSSHLCLGHMGLEPSLYHVFLIICVNTTAQAQDSTHLVHTL